MPPPSTLSLRSVPHIGPLTPFPRHPQASTGGRRRRCFKDVLRTCQETLTYTIHLPWTFSVWLLLHLNSSTVQHDCLHSTLHPLHHTSTDKLSWASQVNIMCDGRSLDNLRWWPDCRYGDMKGKIHCKESLGRHNVSLTTAWLSIQSDF